MEIHDADPARAVAKNDQLLAQDSNSLGQVAEGVSTAETALRIARQQGVQTPITQVVDDVIKAKLPAKDAVSFLMERAPAKEGGFAE